MTQALDVMNPKIKMLQDLFMNCREQLALAVPDHMSPEKLIRLAVTSISNTPKLLECTPKSLFRCLLYSAEYNLEPGPFGLAYYVPFYNNKIKAYEATFLPGYKGVVKLMRNSSQLKNIQAYPVYEKDDFEYRLGLNPVLDHRPTTQKEKGAITHFYCVVKLHDGGLQFTVMSDQEMKDHRQEFSQAFRYAESEKKYDSPWHTDYVAMGCKTVIIKTAKLCPISKDVQNVIAINEATEIGIDQPYTPLTSFLLPADTPSSSEAVGDGSTKKPAKRKLATGTKAVVLPGYIPQFGNRRVTDPQIPLKVLQETLGSAQKRIEAGYPESQKQKEAQDKSLAAALEKVIEKRKDDPAPTPSAHAESTPERISRTVSEQPAQNLGTRQQLSELHDNLNSSEAGKKLLYGAYDNFCINDWRQVEAYHEQDLLAALTQHVKSLQL